MAVIIPPFPPLEKGGEGGFATFPLVARKDKFEDF